MGFGFVVARFGLFLQALQIGQSSQQVRPYGPSFWFGTALIVLGVVVNLVCAWSHVRLVQELNRGGTAFNRPSFLAITVAAILAVLGLAMAIYLVSVREPRQANIEQYREGCSDCESRERHRYDTGLSIGRQDSRKLEQILQARGVKLFSVIDHSGEAEKAGMKMPPTKLLIFGNPKAGTPLMLAAPTAAIDLPLKILVSADAGGKTWISFNSPGWLQARHRLPEDLIKNIAVVEALASQAAE